MMQNNFGVVVLDEQMEQFVVFVVVFDPSELRLNNNFNEQTISTERLNVGADFEFRERFEQTENSFTVVLLDFQDVADLIRGQIEELLPSQLLFSLDFVDDFVGN